MTGTDAAFGRLSDLVHDMSEHSELLRVAHEVSPIHEMAGYVAASKGWPLLFERVAGARFPVLYNVFGDPAWVARQLDTEPDHIALRLFAASRSPHPPRLVPQRHTLTIDEPRLQEWIAMGQDQDRQAVPCLNAGIIIVRDPDTGLQNTSMHTLNLVGDNKLVVHVQSQHFAEIYGRWQKRRVPMPMAVALGVHPAIWLACGLTIEHPPEELDVAGGLGKTVELSACSTIDLAVPADAEVVLEGYAYPTERGPGGPEPLPSFEYGAPYRGPVFTVHRLTAFDDSVSQGLLNAGPDHQNQLAWLKEFSVIRSLESSGLLNAVHAVKVNPSGRDWYGCALSVRRESAHLAREVAVALLEARIAIAGIRRVYVVDADVDVGDAEELEWALCTRMRPQNDVIIQQPVRHRGAEPLTQTGAVSRMAMVAIVPEGQEARFVRARVGWKAEVDMPRVDSPTASRPAQVVA